MLTRQSYSCNYFTNMTVQTIYITTNRAKGHFSQSAFIKKVFSDMTRITNKSLNRMSCYQASDSKCFIKHDWLRSITFHTTRKRYSLFTLAIYLLYNKNPARSPRMITIRIHSHQQHNRQRHLISPSSNPT